jgi:hypothetical protein
MEVNVRASTAVTMLVAFGLLACGRDHAREERLRFEVGRAQLEVDLARLEERLLRDRAMVQYWEEQRARHDRKVLASMSIHERAAGKVFAQSLAAESRYLSLRLAAASTPATNE